MMMLSSVTHIAAVQCELYASSHSPQERQWCEQRITASVAAVTVIIVSSIRSSDYQTMLLSPPEQNMQIHAYISVQLQLYRQTIL
jgi:hypothetical protein